MITRIFLLPLILCLLWALYLKQHNWSLAQGKKGFIYILTLSAIIGGYLSLMLWLT
ncbi:MAG: hypothetical protein HRU23_01300 [Gammaproteobacteria bacterium]|nr:hypothetical protein [Gammaproteobacteria bacterium]